VVLRVEERARRGPLDAGPCVDSSAKDRPALAAEIGLGRAVEILAVLRGDCPNGRTSGHLGVSFSTLPLPVYVITELF
jgi:hypothetical protein